MYATLQNENWGCRGRSTTRVERTVSALVHPLDIEMQRRRICFFSRFIFCFCVYGSFEIHDDIMLRVLRTRSGSLSESSTVRTISSSPEEGGTRYILEIT